MLQLSKSFHFIDVLFHVFLLHFLYFLLPLFIKKKKMSPFFRVWFVWLVPALLCGLWDGNVAETCEPYWILLPPRQLNKAAAVAWTPWTLGCCKLQGYPKHSSGSRLQRKSRGTRSGLHLVWGYAAVNAVPKLCNWWSWAWAAVKQLDWSELCYIMLHFRSSIQAPPPGHGVFYSFCRHGAETVKASGRSAQERSFINHTAL